MITPELWGRSSRPMEEMVTSLCRYSAGMPVAWNRSPKFWNAMFSPEEAEPQMAEHTLHISTMVKALTPRCMRPLTMFSKPGTAPTTPPKPEAQQTVTRGMIAMGMEPARRDLIFMGFFSII